MKVNGEKIERIYDSFVGSDEREIFFVKTGDGDKKWLTKADIAKTLLNRFLKYKQKKGDPVNDYESKDVCHIDKEDEYCCELKCKTRGVLISCTNCGIIVGYKEMYGAESLKQMEAFMLEIVADWRNNFLLMKTKTKLI